MKHIAIFLTLLAVIAASVVIVAPPRAEATGEVLDCYQIDLLLIDTDANGLSYSAAVMLSAGDVVTINVSDSVISNRQAPAPVKSLLRTASPTIVLEVGGAIVATAPYSLATGSGLLTWVVPTDINLPYNISGDNFEFYLTGIDVGFFLFDFGCTPAPETPEGETGVAVPGCDVLINLPSTAVVGSFVSDADLFWQPGSLTDPVLTIGAGNTAWVLGVDANGEYYKILWGCQFVWVPVGTMGPNFDEVWNGTPLPTNTVG